MCKWFSMTSRGQTAFWDTGESHVGGWSGAGAVPCERAHCHVRELSFRHATVQVVCTECSLLRTSQHWPRWKKSRCLTLHVKENLQCALTSVSEQRQLRWSSCRQLFLCAVDADPCRLLLLLESLENSHVLKPQHVCSWCCWWNLEFSKYTNTVTTTPRPARCLSLTPWSLSPGLLGNVVC